MSDLNKQEIVMDEFFNCGFSVMIPYAMLNIFALQAQTHEA
jgi:hypothetical protein